MSKCYLPTHHSHTISITNDSNISGKRFFEKYETYNMLYNCNKCYILVIYTALLVLLIFKAEAGSGNARHHNSYKTVLIEKNI